MTALLLFTLHQPKLTVILMHGFHHSVAVLPLPFRRSRYSRFRTPLPSHIFVLFTAVTEHNFLT